MNITPELQHYYLYGEQASILNLFSQKEIIEKKIHLTYVVSVLNEIQNMIDGGVFKKSGVQFVKIKKTLDYDIGYIIKFDVLDKEKNLIDMYNKQNNYIPVYDQLHTLFEKVSLGAFSSDNFKEKEELTFAIDRHLVENLRLVFLSVELNSSLAYTLLNNDLDDKKLTTPKTKI